MDGDAKDVLIALATLGTSVGLVVVFIGLGWYCMWRLFLSRFQFVREILSSDDNVDNRNPSLDPPPKQQTENKRKIRKD